MSSPENIPVYGERSQLANGGRLIYLHGFRSSPASAKAVWLAQRMHVRGQSSRFICPLLPPSPREAVDLVRGQFDLQPEDTLVGSSLGGYYATWLAEKYGCRAVLLNPAIDPARDLRSLVGWHRMFHDESKSFQFRAEYLDELRELEMLGLSFPKRYFLIAATGDELIDWRDMVRRYGGAEQLVLPGGDHAMSNFPEFGDKVLRFAGML
jgi:uncharacterized protein